MNRKPRLLVFDMDGTLTDTLPVMVAAMKRSIAAVVGPVSVDDRRVREGLGVDLIDTVRELLPRESDTRHAAVVEHYCATYRGVEAELGLRLFDGAAQALQRLSTEGFVLTIATGKSRAGLNRVLPLLGIGHHFAHSRTADETAAKPDPAMLRQLMEVCACKPADTLMIGDTTYDLDMARAAGVRSVALLTGTHPRERLNASQPTWVLPSVAALPELLFRA